MKEKDLIRFNVIVISVCAAIAAALVAGVIWIL